MAQAQTTRISSKEIKVLRKKWAKKMCVVCGKPMKRDPKRYKTCGPECSNTYRNSSFRYQNDKKFRRTHQLARARWFLKNKETQEAADVKWARKVIREYKEQKRARKAG